MSGESQGTSVQGPLLSVRTAASGEVASARPLAGLWARVRGFSQAHPRLVTWLVLGVGMVAILLWASREVDLLPHQRLVLVAATVGMAGLCSWIINWE